MNIKTILECLKYKYPDIKDTEFVLADRGDVNKLHISTWKNINYPEPTIAEIEAVYPQVLREQKLIGIREKRNKLLVKSDVYCFVDSYNKLTATQKTEIETYRQALRDLPITVDVDNPVYPTKPTWAD